MDSNSTWMYPMHAFFLVVSLIVSHPVQFLWFWLSLTQGYFSSCSQDLEDPDLRGGSAGCCRVHAQHLLEGTATQPRAARVRPLQPSAHPHQGPRIGPLWQVAVWSLHQTDVILFCPPPPFILPPSPETAEVPLGRWKQKSLPQSSRECPSWWLWGPWWVNPPTPQRRDQSPLSAFVTGPQLSAYSVCCIYLRALLTWSAWTNFSFVSTIPMNKVNIVTYSHPLILLSVSFWLALKC